jgi:hypothetical protein
MPCGLVEADQFSEEHNVPSSGPESKFRKHQAERFIFEPKDGGSTILRNIDQLLPDYLLRFQKTALFRVTAIRTSNFMKIYYY